MPEFLRGRDFWTTTLPAVVLMAGGLAFLALFAYAGRGPAISGLNDFLPFYAGGRLAFSGHLYDQARVLEEQARVTGTYGENLHFIRPPWFAAAVWLIAQLDFQTAHLIWELVAAGALVLFVFQAMPGSRAVSLGALCSSLPALAALLNGQDTPFLLLWIVLALMLVRGNQPFAAGLVLALCQTKFHLFLPLWLVLLSGRRWRLLGGYAAGNALLILVGALVAGWRWPMDYLASIRNDIVTPAAEHMPTFYWAASGLGIPAAVFGAGAAILVISAAWLAGRRLDVAESIIIVPAFMMPFLQHTYVYDAVVLLPLSVYCLRSGSTTTRVLAVLALTPIPWIGCLAGLPWSLLAPATVTAMVVARLAERPSSITEPHTVAILERTPHPA